MAMPVQRDFGITSEEPLAADSARAFAVEPEALPGSEKRQQSGGEPWLGERIASELVKSYGFAMDSQTGDWSWSLDNIGKQWNEHPFWTTLDYLMLGFPIVKWGTALGGLARGTSLASKAYKGGEFAAREARSFTGRRLVTPLFGSERAAAAEFSLSMPSTFDRATGRMFRSTVSASSERDLLTWAERYGATSIEKQEIAASIFRAKRLEEAVGQGVGVEYGRTFAQAGLDDSQKEASYRLLETDFETMFRAGSPAMTDVVEVAQSGALPHLIKTKDWFNSLHEGAADLGLLSPAASAGNYDRYAPRLAAEFKRMQAESAHGFRGRGSGGVTGAGVEAEASSRFRARTLTESEWLATAFDKITDPVAGVHEMTNVAQLVAAQAYAQGLARSVAAKGAPEAFSELRTFAGIGVPPAALAQHAEATVEAGRALQIGGMAETLGAKLGLGTGRIGPEQARVRQLYEDFLVTSHTDEAKLLADPELQAEFVRRVGYHGDVDALYARAGVPGYLDRIDPKLRHRFLDPHVASDVDHLLAWERKHKDFSHKLYNGVLALFKETKTADNPATWVRNWLGNIFTQSFVLGRPSATGVPMKAIAEWKKGAASDRYVRFLQTGYGKTGFDQETRDALLRSFEGVTKWDESPSAVAKLIRGIPYAGKSATAEAVAKGATKAAEWYGNIDELWKFDTWMKRADHLRKAGHSLDDAERLATLDIAKYMQVFNQRSQIGEVVSRVVPFGGFSTEALRVWKNVLTDKPHMAFFWTHLFDVASQSFGAMAGLSASELESAHASLPSYVKGRKLMALPVAVDGKVRFLDLSYIIPMGNLADMATGEKMFFREVFDPLSNPLIGVAAATQGTDPFTGREIAPRFLERQLGVEVENPKVRRALGLAEYMAGMLSPPLAPGGYALTNLLELARGQRSPVSGAELEESVATTVAANLFGMRTYTPRLESDLQNVLFEQKKRDERMGMAWNDYEWSMANGNGPGMESAKSRILAIRAESGDEAPAEYFTKNVDRHAPGAFSNLSKKQIAEALQRSGGYTLDERDRAIQGELLKRIQKSQKATKKETK